MEDEKGMAEKLGLCTDTNPAYIRDSQKTGRFSVYWSARTSDVKDTVRWAILYPPNDARKRNMVKKWLSHHPNDLESVMEELTREGVPFEEWR